MAMIRLLSAIALLAVCFAVPYAYAQVVGGAGVATNRSTVNVSVVIGTGNVFQSALSPNSQPRQSLTIENNNTTTDNCWVYIGPIGNATQGTAILLIPGGAYTRYWPYVPNDQISVTCATSADTVYVDYQ
jgi:hypothetical protein